MTASGRSGPAGELDDLDAFQNPGELRAVTAMAGGQHDRQRLTALLTRQMQFR